MYEVNNSGNSQALQVCQNKNLQALLGATVLPKRDVSQAAGVPLGHD